MLILAKIILLSSLIGIIYQDFKERTVYLWLLLLTLILFGLLHFHHSFTRQFFVSIPINIGVISTIMLILFLYSKLKLKQSLRHTFGFGDLLFFLAIAVGFPTITFVVLFTFSLFFSLILYLFLKSSLKHNTVPLAGLQALFFSLIFLLHWTFNFINIYQY